MKIGEHETHAAADAFPLLEGDEFDALVADIRENGLHEPIWTDQDGVVLDGRNRLRACHQLGIKPRFRVIKIIGPGHLLTFIWSQNIMRRHLTASQRAIATAKLAALAPGRPSKSRPVAALREADAAKLASVGERTTQRARQVLAHGARELVDLVERGAVSLKVAEEVARLPIEKQRELAAAAAAAPEGDGDRVVRASLAPAMPPAADPAAELLRAIERAIGQLGATCARVDGRGVHVAFRDRVFLVQVQQQTRTAA